MITEHNFAVEQPVVCLGSELVYGYRKDWCKATYRPLRLSLMRSRQCFSYDKKTVLPVILFFCGGGFVMVDRNVWMP